MRLSTRSRFFRERLAVCILTATQAIFLSLVNVVPLAIGHTKFMPPAPHDPISSAEGEGEWASSHNSASVGPPSRMLELDSDVLTFKLWECSSGSSEYSYGGKCALAMRIIMVLLLVLIPVIVGLSLLLLFCCEAADGAISYGQSPDATTTRSATASMKKGAMSKPPPPQKKNIVTMKKGPNPLGHSRQNKNKAPTSSSPTTAQVEGIADGNNNNNAIANASSSSTIISGKARRIMYKTASYAMIMIQTLFTALVLASSVLVVDHYNRDETHGMHCGPYKLSAGPMPSTGSVMLWVLFALAVVNTIGMWMPHLSASGSCCWRPRSGSQAASSDANDAGNNNNNNAAAARGDNRNRLYTPRTCLVPMPREQQDNEEDPMTPNLMKPQKDGSPRENNNNNNNNNNNGNGANPEMHGSAAAAAYTAACFLGNNGAMLELPAALASSSTLSGEGSSEPEDASGVPRSKRRKDKHHRTAYFNNINMFIDEDAPPQVVLMSVPAWSPTVAAPSSAFEDYTDYADGGGGVLSPQSECVETAFSVAGRSRRSSSHIIDELAEEDASPAFPSS